MNKHTPRSREPNAHEFEDGYYGFGDKLSRLAKDHMLTKRGRAPGSSGKGGKSPYPPVYRLRSGLVIGKYMPHQGKKECARRAAQ